MKHGNPMSSQNVSNNPCSGVTHHTQPKKKFKQTLSARKIMCTVFWDCYGVLLHDYRPNGQTINAQVYCDTLQRLLRVIQKKAGDYSAPGWFFSTTTLVRIRLGKQQPYCINFVGISRITTRTVRTLRQATTICFCTWSFFSLENNSIQMQKWKRQ